MGNSKFSNGFGQVLASYTYTYDNVWKDKLVSYNDNGTVYNITYDEIGNPLSYRNGITLDWQNGRELKSVTTDEYTVNYTYNADGLRTSKSTTNGSYRYYYDNSNNLIAMTYDKNTTTLNDDTVLNFYYDSEGQPVAFQVDGETKYYYIKNLQGDVEKIIDKRGNVIASYIYDAWGNVLSQTDNSTNSIATLNPLRYRSYVYDQESGFYYLQSRYYDPQTGRFLNADIYCDTGTGSPLSTNMFAYCENNCVNCVDYNGYNAYWLQDFQGAKGFGHTSLLIQEAPGKWWYFYWGNNDIQLLYFGKGNLSDLNNFLHGENKWNYEFYNKNNNYDVWRLIKGDFTYSLRYIFSELMGFSKNKKIVSYSFKYNNKNYKNKSYSLIYSNCVQMSTQALFVGSISFKLKSKLMLVMGDQVPNSVYWFLSSINFFSQ